MTTPVPLTIPRWQWRTFGREAAALLGRRLAALPRVEVRRSEEVHLVCLHSAHHAWLCGEALELRWRKEVGPEGFELWDTILHARAPFPEAAVARLLSAWTIAAPPSPPEERRDAAALLAGPLARIPTVRPVRVVRQARSGVVDGLACTCETLSGTWGGDLVSVLVEHEDPVLIAQFLAELGLAGRGNTSLLQALKGGLERAATHPEGPTWARKSNASSS